MSDPESALWTDGWGYKYEQSNTRNLRARFAAMFLFVLEGVCISLWGLLMPFAQSWLELSNSALGVASLCTYFATIFAAPLTAKFISKYGIRRCSAVAGVLCSFLLTCITLAPNYGVLCLLMFLFGFQWGALDVTANNAAVLAEVVGEESYLGSCYGSFSVTAAVMGAIGGAMTAAGCSIVSVLVLFTVLFSLFLLMVTPLLYSQQQEAFIAQLKEARAKLTIVGGNEAPVNDTMNSELVNSTLMYASLSLEDSSHAGHTRTTVNIHTHSILSCVTLIPRELLIFSALGFAGTFCEASMVTWLVVYYDQVLDAPAALRTVGFTAQLLAAAVGRFSVDHLLERVSRRALVRIAGLCASSGLLWAFLWSYGTAGTLVMSTMGFILNGFGVSMLAPIAFSSAGKLTSEDRSVLTQDQELQEVSSTTSPLDSIGEEENNSNSSNSSNQSNIIVPADQESLQQAPKVSAAVVGGSVKQGSHSGHSGQAIATVAMFVYCGSIVGAPLVGVLSDLTGSLRYGVLMVALVLLLAFPLSGYFPSEVPLQRRERAGSSNSYD